MDLEVILILYIPLPPSVGSSSGDRLATLDPTIRFAHGPPSYVAEVVRVFTASIFMLAARAEGL